MPLLNIQTVYTSIEPIAELHSICVLVTPLDETANKVGFVKSPGPHSPFYLA